MAVSNDTYSDNFSFSANYSCALELQMLTSGPYEVSEEEQYKRKIVKYYLMGIIGVAICAFGMVGNFVSLLVIMKLGMRTLSTYIYLGSLAICDSLVLIFTMMMLMKDVRYPIRKEPEWKSMANGYLYPYMFPYVHSFDVTFQVTAIWLTLAFTTDRFIMICHPFKAEKLCTPSRAWKVTVALSLSGIVYNLPRFFEYKTVSMTFCRVTMVFSDFTNFGKSDIFRMLFHSWFYLVFVCGVPFLALAIMNSFLIKAVHESRKRGREICAAERKRNDTTIMLIGVIVIFFICQVPALVSRMLWAFNPDLTSTPLYLLNEVGNFLVILNSAINIVPYYFFGKRFRKEFWKLFCSCIVNDIENMNQFLSSNSQTENVVRLGNGSSQAKLSQRATELSVLSRNSSSTALISLPDSGSASSTGLSPSTPETKRGEMNGNYKDGSPLCLAKIGQDDQVKDGDVLL